MKIYLLFALCAALAFSHPVIAKPGDPDPSFGVSGLLVTQLSTGADRAFAVARQADGKIVVAGYRSLGNSFAVVRYLESGALDTSFDGDGIATFFNGFGNEARAVAVQADGKIVVVGRTNSTSLTVIRLNANGSLDTTFDGDGIFTDISGTAGYSVLIQPDGRIVAVGDIPAANDISGQYRDYYAVRLNTDGTPDTSFDGDGRATVSNLSRGTNINVTTTAALQTDGKIVIAGDSNDAFGVARVNADGSLDTSFDGDGKLRTVFASGRRSFPASVAIGTDGRIVVGGYADDLAAQGFAVARYLPDGSLDATFDGDGKTVTQSTGYATSVLAQPDGRIVAIGYTASVSFTLIRYGAQGGLDTSFGGGGIVVTLPNSAGGAYARAALLEPDGKIVAVGSANKVGLEDDFALARYRPDGSAITADGKFGYVVTNPFNDTAQPSGAVAVRMQADGKIVVGANRAFNGTRTIGNILRYTDSGRLDTAFAGGNGITSLGVPFAESEELTSILIQPDGRILAAGNWETSSEAGIFLVQLNVDGTRNLAFGGNGNGYAVLRSSEGGGIAQDIALNADGKILIAGATPNFTTQTLDFAVFRFNADGTKDLAFGTNGIAAVDLGPGDDAAFGLAVRADGKIVAAGAANFSENANGSVAVVQFAISGRIDNEFGTDGKVLRQLGGFADSAFDVAIAAGGRIVLGVTSCSNGPCTSGTGLLLGLTAQGSPDNTFISAALPALQSGATTISSIAIQANGKIVASIGSLNPAVNNTAVAARFLPDGTPDNQFGNSAIAYSPLTAANQDAASVVIQQDGRIVVAGTSAAAASARADITVWRFLGESAARRTAFDFDGDGKADMAVRRPSDNIWYFLRTAAGYTGFEYGISGDLMAPADFDGDGKTDVAVFRPSNGLWYIAGSSSGFYTESWGVAGDIPVAADYDGDGRADPAVFRPSDGTWYMKRSSAGLLILQFGTAEDKPQIGDYDGDGKADLCVRRPSDNTWYFLRSTAGFTGFTWGVQGDIAAPADFDGDGKTDVAVFRPSTGTWYVAGSSTGFTTQSWGTQGDIPVAADYDGDGKADFAVYRPSDRTWYLFRSAAGILTTQFGEAADEPAHSAFSF